MRRDRDLDSSYHRSKSELPDADSKNTARASYPETSVVVDFFRPLLLRLTVWR